MREHFRVVIIGGGMAGLETGFSIGGNDVCVLEAGLSRSATPVTTVEWCRSAERDNDWWAPFASGSGQHFNKGFGLRKRLGGRSLCWHGVSLPIETYAFDQRWTKQTQSWVSAASTPFNIHQDALKCFAKKPSSPTLSGYENAPILRSRHDAGFRTDHVYSPMDFFFESEVHIKLGQTVMSVERDGSGFLTTAICETREIQYSSEIVIFAAGAVANANFCSSLMASRDTARIFDHIVVGRSLIATACNAPMPAYALQYRTLRNYQTRIFLHVGILDGHTTIDMWTMGSDQMTFNAWIQGGVIQVDQHSIATTFKFRCEQLQRIIDNEFAYVIDLLQLRGRIGLIPWQYKIDSHEATLSLGDGTLAKDLAMPFEGLLGASDHEHGTVPFGVINDVGELYEIPGAFFAGPSCFPSLGGTNPSLPTLAQCRVTADRVRSLS